MKPTILVLDDDAAILALFKEMLNNHDIELLLEQNGHSALATIKSARPNLAIVDINLPDISGLEVLREAISYDPGMAVIIITGQSSTQHAIEAMKSGAYDYLTKPFDINRMIASIHKALEYNKLNRKVRYTSVRNQLPVDGSDDDIMIGSSPEMIEIWKMVGRVADTDETVLIQGESGSGKELLARAIFSNSRRNNKPFLAVNCAAMPETLLESELFGHEKGAFTDAHSRKLGKFEVCDGGTILLDEIGEMSLSNQGKLLRVLEEGTFERLGGTTTIKVNVRVISATNKSLVAAVKDKMFRMDLFYRLKVISLFLPRLRDRVEDIPLLTELFVRQFSRKYAKKIRMIAPETIALLCKQPWNGNIRELKNVINSSLVFSKGDILMPGDVQTFLDDDVSPPITDAVPLLPTGATTFEELFQPYFEQLCATCSGNVFDSATRHFQKNLVNAMMSRCNNNQVQASKLLGISRNTLRDRLCLNGAPNQELPDV